jgi:subtilisin family serine protease
MRQRPWIIASLAAAAGALALVAPHAAFSQSIGPSLRPNISVGPRIGTPSMIPMGPRTPNFHTGPRYTPPTIGDTGRRPGIDTGVGIGVGIGTGIVTTIPSNPQPVYEQRIPKKVVAKPSGNGKPPATRNPAARGPQPSGPVILSLAGRPHVTDEVLVEIAGLPSEQVIDDLARRHALGRLEAQAFNLTNSTFLRLRISDGRSVETVLRQLQADPSIRSFQANFLFALSGNETASAPADASPVGDPAQYTLAKLRIPLAHSLAKGDRVLVAVIDSGIDANHPEISSVIADRYDALDSGEPAHDHGTAIAGAIAAQSRLRGVAPAANILAIRAFGSSAKTAEGTTFAILKGLDWAISKNARIINMSFAGPQDPALSRALAAARHRGAILIAAAGNAGAKSPPLYPAADPNVIAVTATDANDKLFGASNRGDHIAVAAPGVDILLPAPDANYQMSSGTSFAAAHISGVAALLLERKAALSADAVRKILVSTARDLGPKGRDRDFGAGLADAYLALENADGAVASSTAAAR